MNTESPALKHKKLAKRLLDNIANANAGTLNQRLDAAYHKDAHWRGSHPLNELDGLEAIEETVWAPLLHAIPDLERRDNILLAGSYQGRHYVGAVGHYVGRFERDWLGIPATHGVIYMRYGEFHQLIDEKISTSTALIDVLDVIYQAGLRPLPPSLGVETLWPGPLTADGVVFGEQDHRQSADNLALTLAMQQSLQNTITGRQALLNMAQVKYWHPKMMWYGPAGIGTCRGLCGFVDCHQLPFRRAFPERDSGNNHYVRIADGNYTATGGWPSVMAKHRGGGWLGLGPSGRDIDMRVMDFYRCDGGRIRENWVPLDLIHILLQMDLDIMARLPGANRA